jgi:hypothetical protein
MVSVAVDNLSSMSDRFAGFDGRCKRLPKKVRTWETYAELRRRISLFSEVGQGGQASVSPFADLYRRAGSLFLRARPAPAPPTVHLLS